MSSDRITQIPGYTALNIASGAKGHGDSVREDKLRNGPPFFPPDRVYVVYISMDSNGALIVHQKPASLNGNDVNKVEDDVIDNIIKTNPAPTNFSKMMFDRPSYFTIVLDVDDWDFYYPDPNNRYPSATEYHDPVVFLEKKTIIVEVPSAGGGKWAKEVYDYVMNKSFYNMVSIVKDVRRDGVTKQRSAIRCINFLSVNDDGDPPAQGQCAEFGFNILVRVPYSSDKKSKVTLIIDPDGQNQGPPPQPVGEKSA